MGLSCTSVNWRAAGRWPRIAALALALSVSSQTSVTAQSAPPPKVAASIARLFGKSATTDTIQADGAAVLRIHDGGATAGYALVRNVLGKDQPITFLVATDTAGVLRDVDILVYREPYGGEVAYEAWRKQFRGKTASDPLVIGKDIRSISGATISSNSVTLGVRTALADLARWKSEGKLK
ncbi:MAG TPA: FMN-binding protein [Gemmatimonadales bacterium]|nr:FMN-binding protein [Gemmatimonadales bacterium]